MQFKKRKESEFAIECSKDYGPDFCNDDKSDLAISFRDSRLYCYFEYNGKNAFECKSKYKSALFTGEGVTNGAESFSCFVLDYEVYRCI